ncbi:MAG: DUF1360 domain-containing protein [Patescibacteria group bacterium]
MKAFWNILFSLFFFALVLGSFMLLSQQGSLKTDIPWTDLILLSLATFRLVRLFTYDHITQFLREWVSKGKEGTFVGTLRDLLGCPWCTGVWFGFLTYAGYSYSREMIMPVILILSIAALASVFQIFTNLVGWNAEEKKIDVAQKA